MERNDDETLRPEDRSPAAFDATSVGSSPSILAPGDRIGGYELIEMIGRGGMGLVYRARDPHLDRIAALKLIRPEILDQGGRERFLREARACSKIQHPNIITVYAAGEDRGFPWLAMEFVEGRTLSGTLEEGPLPWHQALDWCIDLLDALEDLHQNGIVHRDLKPDNVMVSQSGTVKLMDFGLASLSSATSLTVEGATLGTVHYMSPEQAQGQRSDARGDVFSMGIVLYEMLAGRRPFTGEHAMSVLYAIHSQPAEPLDLAGLGAPHELQTVLERALAKDPAERYASGGEFAEALRAVRGDAPAGEKARRWPIVVAVVAVLVALTAIVFFGGGGEAEPDRQRAVQHNELAQDYEAQGRLVEARGEYRKAILADPGYPLPWNNLALMAKAAGEVDEADSLLNEALKRDPRYAAALLNQGDLRWDRKDYTGSEASYRAALEADPGFVAAWNNLASLMILRSRPASADSALTRGLALEPENPALLRNRARWLELQGETSAARAAWNRVLELGNAAQKADARRALARLGSD